MDSIKNLKKKTIIFRPHDDLKFDVDVLFFFSDTLNAAAILSESRFVRVYSVVGGMYVPYLGLVPP